MKKILILFTAVLVCFGLIACGKEEPKNQIIGTWYMDLNEIAKTNYTDLYGNVAGIDPKSFTFYKDGSVKIESWGPKYDENREIIGYYDYSEDDINTTYELIQDGKAISIASPSLHFSQEPYYVYNFRFGDMNDLWITDDSGEENHYWSVDSDYYKDNKEIYDKY